MEIAESIRKEHSGAKGENKRLARKYQVSPDTIRKVMGHVIWAPVKRKHAESILQRAIVNLLRLNARSDIRWFHVGNERKTTPQMGRIFKDMGVSPGVPDLVIVMPNGITKWMEVKSEGGTVSPVQRAWQDFLVDSGYQVVTVYSLEEAQRCLSEWGCFKRPLSIAA
jgi:hypothetical protein